MGNKITVEFSQYGEDYSEVKWFGFTRSQGSRKTLKISGDDPSCIQGIAAAAAKSFGNTNPKIDELPPRQLRASLSPKPLYLPPSKPTPRKRFLGIF